MNKISASEIERQMVVIFEKEEKLILQLSQLNIEREKLKRLCSHKDEQGNKTTNLLTHGESECYVCFDWGVLFE